MNRSMGVTAIAIVLAAYGLYVASFVPGLAVAPAVPILLVAFVAQVVAAFVAAAGVWFERPWATAVLVVLGLCIAATWLFEGFVLGLVAYLHALAVAVVALVLCVMAAFYVRHQRATV